MTKGELVAIAEKAIGGDREAFGQLVEIKSRDILFTALSFMKNQADAEDASQEAILQMYRSISHLRNAGAVESWIYRIVRNKCIELLKSRNKRAGDVDIDDETVAGEIEDNDAEFVPERYAEDSELRRLLYEIVMSLPQKRREAVILFYYDGLSLNEIAAVTGSKAGTVSSTIAKARKMIKDKIEEKEASGMAVYSGLSYGVLGKALRIESESMIPDTALTDFSAKWQTAAKGYTYGAAKGSGSFAKIAAIAAAVIIAVSGGVVAIVGTYGGGYGGGNKHAVAAPAAVSDITAASLGNIIFTGADAYDGYYNPGSADIESPEEKTNDMSVTWSISAAGTDKAIYSGEGRRVTEPFAALKEAKAYGRYELRYSFEDSGGAIIYKSREFEIGE
jgi:RNA polymerase sigma-70 factor (ECF subfamily)